jgi:hypothetical protein
MFFTVDCGRSKISVSTSQGVRHRCFLELMVALTYLWHRPPGGPSSTFLALMVGAHISLAPPPRGFTIDIFCVDGECFRTSGTASQGPTVNIFSFTGERSWTSGTTSQGACSQHFLTLMVVPPDLCQHPPRAHP